MRFQRQDCVLGNDYKDLSITETLSLYIHLGSSSLSLTVVVDTGDLAEPLDTGDLAEPLDTGGLAEPIRHVTWGFLPSGLIGPRGVRWYKAGLLPGLDRNITLPFQLCRPDNLTCFWNCFFVCGVVLFVLKVIFPLVFVFLPPV
jgi:hypothetical protein